MASSFTSLTPIAWRLADADEAVAYAEQAWQRAIREGRSANVIADKAIDVNWALDARDEIRGEAGL